MLFFAIVLVLCFQDPIFAEDKNIEADGLLTREFGKDEATNYLRQASLYKGNKDYQKELACYNKAIEIDPNYALAYLYRGGFYSYRFGGFELALADFNKAIELEPTNASFYTSRGVLYEKEGQHDKAVEDLRKAEEMGDWYAASYLESLKRRQESVKVILDPDKLYRKQYLVKPESKLEAMTLFWGGIVIIIALCGGGIIFIYSLFSKLRIIRTCPVAEFSRAKKIIIPLRYRDIVISRDLPEFNSIINNFTDEKIRQDSNVYGTKIIIKIRNRRYAIEVSIEGWNFLGEEKNCRRLRDGIDLMSQIDSAKEKLRDSQ